MSKIRQPGTTPRLNIDWAKIKLEFVHTNARVADLAAKYSLKEDTIWKKVTRDGWTDMRADAEQKAFANAAGELAKQRVKDLAKFNEDDLKIARAIRGRIATRFNNAEAAITPSELRSLAATAEAAQRMGRLALGASTDNVGLAGPGGEGPVATTNVSKEDYLKARKEVLEEY